MGQHCGFGIERARGKFIISDEIDILDVGFYRRALEALVFDQADLVIGSKLHADAHDKRPFMRHVASKVITGMLSGVPGLQRARIRTA